jgi:ribosome-binding protein aMBF1 (putative translation factor)
MSNNKFISPLILDMIKTRNKNGLYQKDLAFKFQVTTNTVARWERGEMQPDDENKIKIKCFLWDFKFDLHK